MADNSIAQARYRAKQLGLALKKSREPIGPDNRGGFQIVDPKSGNIVAGDKFDLMTADDAIAFLNDFEAAQ